MDPTAVAGKETVEALRPHLARWVLGSHGSWGFDVQASADAERTWLFWKLSAPDSGS